MCASTVVAEMRDIRRASRKSRAGSYARVDKQGLRTNKDMIGVAVAVRSKNHDAMS